MERIAVVNGKRWRLTQEADGHRIHEEVGGEWVERLCGTGPLDGRTMRLWEKTTNALRSAGLGGAAAQLPGDVLAALLAN